MSDRTIELNRRRVLGGLITIGGAAAAAGAGTAAYFFDETESSGNTISAGELSIDDISTQTWDIGPLVPGNGDTITVTSGYNGDVASPDLDWGIVVANDTAGLAGELELVEASLNVASTQVNDYATDTGVD